MQIAQIVPKIKTRGSGIFDYSIPASILPSIKIGLLVTVPFRGRKIEGIIVNIKKSSTISSLKPIISVIDQQPVIDENHIKLAEWVSNYYLTDFSKALFENIVPPAKRTIKKLFDDNLKNISTTNKKSESKKYLILSDFSKRLEFYQKIIDKTLSQNQQIIILIPDLSLIRYFSEKFNNMVIFHAGLTITERWLAWHKIRQNEAKIIIGSTSAIFSPVKNLGLIIIDQEEDETFKNDQSPRFQIFKVATELSKLTNANLVIGSNCPSVETYFQAKKNKFLYKIKSDNNPSVSIVNMNFERQIISAPLYREINQTLSDKGKILLALNRKGEGKRISCNDCGWISKCPQCQLPLVPTSDQAFCFNCEKNFDQPSFCPNCRSINLKNSGLATAKLEKIVQKNFPLAKITRIEKDYETKPNWDIAVGTSFALKNLSKKINLVAIIDADQNLNFPGYRTQEKNFQTYFRLLKLCDKGIIQTHLPESFLIRNLAKLDYDGFFNEEIKTRKKFFFPPYSSLIKLTYRHNDEKICQNEAGSLFQKIEQFQKDKNLNLVIMGPNPAAIEKKRNLYYYQIVLKQNHRSCALDDYLKNAAKNWIIDVDPFDLV